MTYYPYSISYPPLDRRSGTRPPLCPDCGASWQRGVLHACLPPEPTGFWARLFHRLRMWYSPPVEFAIVFDDEVPRPQPMPRPYKGLDCSQLTRLLTDLPRVRKANKP